MEKTLILLVVLSTYIAHVSSHAYLSSIAVDGLAYKEGVCGRPHPSSKYDYPIAEGGRPNGLSSNDMTCGWLPAAAKAADKKCPVNPGSSITLQWHYEMGSGDKDTFIIDPSHKGPCIVYMAKSETGSGKVWFKVFEDGYDAASKKFCVTRLRENKGKMTFKLPTDITPGNYLMRAELIALHEGHELNGAQPYVGCFEVTMGGSGTVNPSNLVSIPGVYTPNDAGIYFNIYKSFSSYPIPGPKLYVSGATTPTPPPSTPPPSTPPPAATTAKKAVTTAKAITTKSSTGGNGNGNNGNNSGNGNNNGNGGSNPVTTSLSSSSTSATIETNNSTETGDMINTQESSSSFQSVSFLVIVLIIGLIIQF